jgi:hypothetical protein
MPIYNYSTERKISIFIVTLIFFVFAKNLSAQRRYFYTNKPYGSEALFNPISLFINGGYDICQLQSVPNKIGDNNYSQMFKNVISNLADPFPRIRKYGTKKFFTTELLPMGFTKDNGFWIPNYQQHLIGCGMLYTAMREWYEEHNFPAPWLLSSATIMAQHMMNEVMETGNYVGWSVDEISDIYVFDLGGILLFSFDNVNAFFHDKLNLSDWSNQASITLPGGRVNAGQFFAIKWKLPFSEKYSLFYRYGMGALFGFSQKKDTENSVSVGLGFKTKHLVSLSSTFRERTIETGWYAGVFYDRNNSLLASVTMSGVKEYFCSIDVYPGIIKFDNFSPGLWTIIQRDGKFTLGFTTTYLIGTGFSNFK